MKILQLINSKHVAQIVLNFRRSVCEKTCFYKWGRKIMICDAFFSKFCQISTISTFDYLTILYSY